MNAVYKDALTQDEERIFKPGQMELFPIVSKDELMNTLFLLKKYPYMKMLIRDYEEHADDLRQTDIEGETAKKESGEEYYANKTANAVIFAEKQRLIYLEYKTLIRTLERAYGLILDEDEKKAVYYRYLEGYDYKIALKFFANRMSDRTFDRRLAAGIMAMANSLKIWGVLEREWKY